MGNASSHGSASSWCRIDFLSPNILTQTSLYPASLRRLPTPVSNPFLASKNFLEETELNTWKTPDSPDNPDHEGYSPISNETRHALSMKDFHIVKVLGTGGCGRIYLVKKNVNGKLYVMKTVSKRKANSLECIDSFYFEREILRKANHPFIPKLQDTFENDKKIFSLFEYVETEELETMLQRLNRFSEEITKFYSAEIVLVLEYLHKEIRATGNLNIHKIFVDPEGHITLSDFSGSQDLDPINIGNKVITRRRMNDFWELGRLMFELLTGQDLLLKNEEHFDTSPKEKTVNTKIICPNYLSKASKDLITRLMNPQIKQRLGFNSFIEIKQHPFFEGINWHKLQRKLVYPPIKPHHDYDTNKDSEALQCVEVESPEYCELDEIMAEKPNNITTDTTRGESFHKAHNTIPYLED